MTLRVSPQQTEVLGRMAALIEDSPTIAICAHTSPDGDAIGSGLALAMVIRAHCPRSQVTNLLADNAPVPRIYRFLPGADGFVRARDYHEDPDLFISVDLSRDSRLNEAEAVLGRSARHAIIDHHPCTSHTGDVALIRPDAAAAGVLVTEFAQQLGVALTPAMAQCLFCAVTTDTGRFQYQNANPEAFQVASLLVDAGARPSEVSLNVYQSFSLSYLHLEAAVMARITTFAQGRIAYSYATEEDFERTNAQLDECDGLIDVVRSVAGGEVALFLKEVPGGQVRGNLRSKNDLDVSHIAAELGGGGHRAAAGFTFDGELGEALSAVLPLLRALFDDEGPSRATKVEA